MTDRPLVVGFVLPHFRPGGAERVVLNWIGALDRTRFRPLLFLSRVDGAFLDLLPADARVVSLGGSRAALLPRRIAQGLRQHHVDLAYSATNAMNLALLTGAGGGRIATIVSEHTPPGAYLRQAKLPRLRCAAMGWLYPRADAVAVPTQAIAAELQALIRRPLAVTTLPNPVIATMTPPGEEQRAGDVPLLVAAGRLVPAKGFDVLIDACARLVGQGVRLRLVIHGEGPLYAALTAQIAGSGLTEVVTLSGYSADLGRELGKGDLFVLSSRREGFGNVVIEAMAAGVPVLATRSGGPEALITEGVNGFLAPPEDADALARAIATLLADPHRRLGVRGPAATTAARYDIATATRAFEALARGILARRSMST